MVLGVLVAYLMNLYGAGSPCPDQYVLYISILTDVFLRLIKMNITPLVFTTLVVGIAKMGDASTIGRVGLKTFS